MSLFGSIFAIVSILLTSDRKKFPLSLQTSTEVNVAKIAIDRDRFFLFEFSAKLDKLSLIKIKMKIYLPVWELNPALQLEKWGYLPLHHKGLLCVWYGYFVTNDHTDGQVKQP